jgi:hypothetical protein
MPIGSGPNVGSWLVKDGAVNLRRVCYPGSTLTRGTTALGAKQSSNEGLA